MIRTGNRKILQERTFLKDTLESVFLPTAVYTYDLSGNNFNRFPEQRKKEMSNEYQNLNLSDAS